MGILRGSGEKVGYERLSGFDKDGAVALHITPHPSPLTPRPQMAVKHAVGGQHHLTAVKAEIKLQAMKPPCRTHICSGHSGRLRR